MSERAGWSRDLNAQNCVVFQERRSQVDKVDGWSGVGEK